LPQALNFSIEIYDLIYQKMCDDLVEKSWTVMPDYFQPDLIALLNQELSTYQASNALSRAGIGRSDAFKIDDRVRGDKILWLSPKTKAQNQYLEAMESLRMALNRLLFLGLFEFESHFAVYEPGAHYQKHKDSFKGAANRILTTVTYLNDNWQDENLGFLVIYHPESDTEAARIKPEAGTLVLFLSEDIAHEVEPTARYRASIAGWFRCNASTPDAIDPLS